MPDDTQTISAPLDTNAATTDEFTVMAAYITGAHGVGGNVRFRLIGQDQKMTARLLENAKRLKVMVEPDGEPRFLTMFSLRQQAHVKAGYWIGRFKEVKDRNEAEALLGHTVFVSEAERPALPDGEYYVDDLIGLDVLTDTGHDLGKLKDVLTNPANDVYVTDKDILIPAVAAFIISVDLTTKQILVRDVPGLREGT